MPEIRPKNAPTVIENVGDARADVAALAAWMQENGKPISFAIARPNAEGEIPFIVLPDGFELHGIKPLLDEYRERPDRRAGEASVVELDTLIAIANRFKDQNSALFADPNRAAPALLAVFDYHEAGGAGLPRFGGHRARYAFPMSDEWKAWHAHDGKPMTQGDLAAFLEDRIIDVIAPPDFEHARFDATDDKAAPEKRAKATLDLKLKEFAELVEAKFATAQRLMQLSRTFQVHASEKVLTAQNLGTGEMQISYQAEHQGTGGGKVDVPGLFLIGIPVFKSGAPYRLVVRLRYRLSSGNLTWFYQLHRADLVFEHALREACERARAETELPLFYGTPER